MAEIIDGKKISQQIKDELKERAAVLRAQGKTGALAVIQVGADPASCVYVRNKFSRSIKSAIGLPTILLLPIITQCFPAISIPERFI